MGLREHKSLWVGLIFLLGLPLKTEILTKEIVTCKSMGDRWRACKTRSSVLSRLSINLLADIQLLTSWMHDSMRSLDVVGSPAALGVKDK